MIGLMVIAIVILFSVFYLWLLLRVVKFVKRKTGSNLLAGLSVLVVLALTIGDTVFNRLYHKEVLCKGDEVGIKMFSTIAVPSKYWNDNYKRPDFDLAWGTTKPFMGRYTEINKNERGGLSPFTAYWRKEVSVVDIQTGQTLSRFVDFEPGGGFWWLMPLKFINADSLIGWLFSRDKSSKGCFGDNSSSIEWSAIYGAFKKMDIGDKK